MDLLEDLKMPLLNFNFVMIYITKKNVIIAQKSLELP